MKVKMLILLLLVSVILSAQENNVLHLNLEKSIKIALENNNDLKQVKLDKKKAEEQVTEAYGTSLFPSIDGTVTYNRAIKRSEITIETPFFSGSFPAGTQNTMTASVRVEQPLFTGAMFLAVRIAETFADISKQAEKYSEADLVMKVKRSYYTYLLAQEFLKLSRLQLDRAEENLKNTKSMYDNGLVPEYDYIKANVQYQNLVPSLTEAENQLKLSKNNLRIILGLDLDRQIEIDDSLTYHELPVPELNEGLQRVLNQNYLIKQKELEVQMNDYTTSYQYTKHFPELSAFGNWQAQAQENDPRHFNEWRYKNSFAVGLTLKVPIFKGFSISSRVEQAELDLKKSQEGLSKVKKIVKNDFENAILKVKKTEEQIDAYKAAVDEAERGYEISQKRFKSGLGTQLEVTNALVDVTSAEVNYFRAIHEYYVNHAKVDLLLGKTISVTE